MNGQLNMTIDIHSDESVLDDLDQAPPLNIPFSPDGSHSGLLYNKEQVASLKQSEICHMTNSELIAAIRGTELPLLTEEQIQRLMFQDRDTLERLLYLARRCVRNQGY